MASQSLALVDVLAHIPDFRQSSGKRFGLASVLSLSVAAMLCGYTSYSAIAHWGRNYGRQLSAALGFKDGKTPCAATFYNIFSRLDTQDLEQQLGTWAESVQALSESEHELEPISIDGKTLRGSKKQGAPAAHLLSALGHRLGLTLFQVGVCDKTNEIGAMPQLLAGLILKDKLITMDALLTQRQTAHAIVSRGGDYVMMVKANQPSLLAKVEGAIAGVAFYRQAPQEAESLDSLHGRIEHRKIIATSALADSGLWPGLDQAFRIQRRVIEQKSEQESYEEVYGITSLSRERATAEVIMEVVRRHWSIENKSHWVRDVVYEEDRSQVRKGSVPQVMAALRNTAIGLMRCRGESNIAGACRRFAAQPWAALALIGINVST
jgi:predicted transposase YbfD/YdcC